jgi:AcrR family transcriptional regulator
MSSDRGSRRSDLRAAPWAEVADSPRARRHPKIRREIVQAALRLVDREGLDAVSMRRLAAELDMGTMTLYSYVASKAELVTLMVDALGQEMLLDEVPPDWRDALRAIARRSREAMRRHPWMITGRDAAEPQLPPSFARHIDQSLQAVAGLDVDPATKNAILRSVDDLVIGCVLDENEQEAREGAPTFSIEDLRAMAEREGLEHLRASLDDGVDPHASHFEQGLEWLIAGIEADLQRRGAL